ncbi:MAG: hypothetical protein HC883_03805 [Bdellovibrionaceae bacterium]|nr:hypothetical protein [Pseudobdellovibrionaceae bacterium]
MPLVADGKKFADPARRPEIKNELKALAQAATAVANDNKAPNADPIIAFNSMTFANEARQAYASFEQNDLQWARFSLARTSSYCIGCHTRADRGVKDFPMSWNAEFNLLTPAQSVEFLLANRRYKSAVEQAKRLAADQTAASKDPRGWILPIEKTLAMIVRVNKDTLQAEELVKLVASNKSAPAYLRRDAAAWKSDIREWREDERTGRAGRGLKLAIRLVERAQNSGPRNSAALIRYLRASGILAEEMEKTQSSRYAETLLYAGMVADALRDLNMGALDQFYYESCINHVPHSEMAEQCFSLLEASVRDANPFIEIDPDSELAVAARLDEYRRLAQVKDLIEDPRWLRRSWDENYSGSERGSSGR